MYLVLFKSISNIMLSSVSKWLSFFFILGRYPCRNNAFWETVQTAFGELDILLLLPFSISVCFGFLCLRYYIHPLVKFIVSCKTTGNHFVCCSSLSLIVFYETHTKKTKASLETYFSTRV